jgi:hypothetical protein
MSRKKAFRIKHLLGKISIPTATGRPFTETCALWMNFHRVYPERYLVC